MRSIYLLGLMLCLSCSNKNHVSDEVLVNKPDQIDYYRLAVSDKELVAIFNNENMSSKERRLAEIMHHDAPTTLADSAFVADMDNAPYYVKFKLDKDLHDKILQSFVSHETFFSANFVATTKLCAPTYRDILIFRKESKITGFAKLCFACSQIHTAGMYPKDEEVEVDYEGLRKLLSQTGN